MSENIEQLSDWDLLELCKQQDERAWEVLVDRHKHSLRLSVRRGLAGEAKDIQLVEDLSQEALVALIDEGYRRLGIYNPQESCFDTFLRVLANEVIWRRCAKGRRRKHEVPLNGHDPTDPAGNDGLAQAELSEYLEDLTPQERRCLREKVLRLRTRSTGPAMSPGNERLLRHRLRDKWKEHFDTP